MCFLHHILNFDDHLWVLSGKIKLLCLVLFYIIKFKIKSFSSVFDYRLPLAKSNSTIGPTLIKLPI